MKALSQDEVSLVAGGTGDSPTDWPVAIPRAEPPTWYQGINFGLTGAPAYYALVRRIP